MIGPEITQTHPAAPVPDFDEKTNEAKIETNGVHILGGPATGLVIVHRLEIRSVIPTAATQKGRSGYPESPTSNPPRPQPSGSRSIRSVLRGAFQVVMVVVRNALGCLLCALAANFCYSLGNVFSLRKSAEQSTDSLSVASMVWTNLLFCTLQLLTHTTMLLPNRFLIDPTKHPSALFCMKKLVKRTYKYFFASTVLMTAWAGVVNKLLGHLRPLKLNFYVGTILIHVYSAGIDLATRTIFSEETCQGQARRDRILAAAAIANASAANRVGIGPGPRLPAARRGRRSYWRIFIKTFPKALITMFAGAYVQIASRSDIFSHGPAIVAFAIVSYVVKLVIQELAQVYAMRRNIEQVRVMCILVGVPTVLIDTQVRIVLLGVQSGQFAIAGTFVMAAVEFLMRSGKMLLLKFEIKHRLRAIERQPRTASSLPSSPPSLTRTLGQHHNRVHPSSVLRGILTFSGRVVASEAAFERWKKQRVDFHTAEIIADMYAEYIAIGCSASILHFFSGHPKYQYGELSSAESSSSSAHGTAASSSSLYQSLALQFGVEVVVDFLSCAFEIASGAHFGSVRKLSSYLAFMFMTTAVVNIGISSFLYLK